MQSKLGTNWMLFARLSVVVILVAATGLLVLANGKPEPAKAALGAVNLPRGGSAFEKLSEYNLFQDFATQTPNAGVVPYDIATPLFTDYSSKHRFVYMPDGQAAQYDPERMFDYPVGTILVKTFGYLNDIRDASQGEELIETRLLIRDSRNWTAWTYVYDEAAEDAVLAVDGASRQMTWTHYDGNERSIDYIVPTQKDCRGCHNERYNVVPIGPKAWNLNREFEYDHGTENQLAHWSDIGILEGAPAHETAPALPVWNDETSGTLDARARAYLEVNCAHCHNPSGPANDSGLDLAWTQDDPYALGVGRRLAERGGDWEEGRREDRDRDRAERRQEDGDRDRGERRWEGGDRDRDERDRDDRRRDDGDRDRDDRRRDDDDRGWFARLREDGAFGWFGSRRDERRRDWGEPDWGEGDFDLAGREFDIVPGKPDESLMVYRMESLVPEVTMPKVPHLQIHEEGVALIREWIAAMEEQNVMNPAEG